ncbi:MAG: hypothetical protein HKM23_01855 [Nitrosopumilus sp.]|nr:hypothetical protein [Nitrosopumilus sp.]
MNILEFFSMYFLKYKESIRVNKLGMNAITLFIKNMGLEVKFRSNISGFEIIYDISKTKFVTFKMED